MLKFHLCWELITEKGKAAQPMVWFLYFKDWNSPWCDCWGFVKGKGSPYSKLEFQCLGTQQLNVLGVQILLPCLSIDFNMQY